MTTKLLIAAGSVSGGGSGGGAPSGAAGGDLTGTYPNPTLTAGAVDLSGAKATGVLAAGRFPALTGDVTTSSGALATTIAAGAVTLAKQANLAANSIQGNNTGSPATPIALTVAQVKTLLAYAQSDITGTLAIGAGGTGQTTQLAAKNALLPKTVITITESADTFTIVDVAAGDTFRCALTTGTNTIAVPGGTPYGGQRIRYRMEQDGTGGRTVAFSTSANGHKIPDSIGTITLSTAASKVDWVDFEWEALSTKWICVGYILGIA